MKEYLLIPLSIIALICGVLLAWFFASDIASFIMNMAYFIYENGNEIFKIAIIVAAIGMIIIGIKITLKKRKY